MASDILTLADTLVTDFQARINPVDPTPNYTTVSRQYELTHDLGMFTGRKVEFYPVGYSPIEEMSRTEVEYEFQYSIVVMERYRDKGNISKVWIDALVRFTKDYIFSPLDNVNGYIITDGGIRYWVERCEVTTMYDFDFLRQHRVFWSEVEIALRRVTDGI